MPVCFPSELVKLRLTDHYVSDICREVERERAGKFPAQELFTGAMAAVTLTGNALLMVCISYFNYIGCSLAMEKTC